MKNQIRWIFRDFKGAKGLFFSLFLSLFIGFSGFTLVESLRSALKNKIQLQAKASLTADLSVSIRRGMRSQEIEKLNELILKNPNLKSTRVLEFFSMVVTGDDSRLIQVKAVSPGYPFYGEMKLSQKKFNSGDSAEIFTENKAWAYPELLEQLNLKIGDSIKLGGVDFKIVDSVLEDSTQTFRLASLAPKIYVGVDPILKTGLISAGTTMTEAYLIKTPNDQLIPEVANKLKSAFQDPAFRVEDYKEESEDSGRALSYVLDYLGLVSLIALILSGVGASFLFKSHFDRQKMQVAIFNALGMRKSQSQWRILIELQFLSLLAAGFAAIFSYLVFSYAKDLLATWIPGELTFAIGWGQVALISGVSISLPLIFMGPWLWSLGRVSTISLLREDAQTVAVKKSSNLTFGMWIGASLGFLWVLCFIQSKSYFIGSLFLGMLLAAFLILFAMGFLATRMLEYFKNSLSQVSWSSKYLLTEAARRFRSTIGFFIAFGLGGFLLFLIPVLKGSLLATIERPQGIKLPELFLFDIQDDQVEPLKKIISEKKLEASPFSPLVRARILSINGESYERKEEGAQFKSKEEEEASRFRNRGVNLSYRSELSSSEAITDGKMFTGDVSANSEGALPVAELSVEKRFAERVGLKLQDQLIFDVQGVEVQGRVTSFREVKWNSFQPNFFIIVQPGVLEEAPKTHLVSLYNFKENNVYKLQGEISKTLPNVSIVDVRKLVEKVIEISNQFTLALQAMAFLSLFVGLVIFVSLCIEESRKKVWDYALLKVIGAKKASLRSIATWQGVIIGVLALSAGLVLSVGVAFVLLNSVFDAEIFIPWKELGILFLATLATLILISNIILSQVYKAKPGILLNSSRQGV